MCAHGIDNSSTINEIRKATNGKYVLGNDRFKDEIEDMLQRRVVPKSNYKSN